MPQSDFLWINKSPASASLSQSGDESGRIRRHVRVHRNQGVFINLQIRYDTAGSASSGPSTEKSLSRYSPAAHTPTLGQPPDLDHRTLPAGSQLATTTAQRRVKWKSSKIIVKSDTSGIEENARPSDVWVSAKAGFDRSEARSGDHFDEAASYADLITEIGDPERCLSVYPVPAEQRVHTSIQSFWALSAGGQPLSAGGPARPSNPHLGSYFPISLSDPDVFAALVTFAESWRLTYFLGEQNPVASKFYLRYRATALAGLRRKVLSPDQKISSSDESIMIGVFLMRAAARFGCLSESRSHWFGVKKMLALRGGIDNLNMNHFMKTGIQLAMSDPGLFTNQAGGTWTDENPDLQLHYPELPLSHDLKIALSTLPTGFGKLTTGSRGYSVLSVEVLHMALALPTWTVLETQIPGRKTEISGGKFIRLLLVRSHHPVERMVCLGLLLYMVRAMQGRGIQVEVDLRLIRSFGAIEDDFAGEQQGAHGQELRLWITLMAAEVTSEGYSGLREIAEPRLDALLKYDTWAREWEEVERALKSFFWTEDLIEAWRTCWLSRLASFGRQEARSGNRSANSVSECSFDEG